MRTRSPQGTTAVLGLGSWGREVLKAVAQIGPTRLARISATVEPSTEPASGIHRHVAMYRDGLGSERPNPRAAEFDRLALLELLSKVDWLFLAADPDEPRWGSVAQWAAEEAATRGTLVTPVLLHPRTAWRGLGAAVIDIALGAGSSRTAAEGVALLNNILQCRGFVGISFDDVQQSLDGGNNAQLSVGRAAGAERGSQAMRSALSELVRQRAPLAVPGRVLVAISGSSDVSLIEVDQALRLLHDHLHPDTEIVFGFPSESPFPDELVLAVVFRPSLAQLGQ